MVIGAHSADFVWRAGGAIAVATSDGGGARVLALSYGERGESGELWKEAGQTVERVKEIRHGEAERAAAALGAEFECLDLGDYPLEIDGNALVSIADRIREFSPDVLITHTDRDPFNPDHASCVLRRREGSRARRGRGRSERVRDRRAAGAPALRAAPAGALQLRAHDLRRHHARDRAEERRDGGDEGAGLPRDLLRPAGRATRRTMRAARPATRRSGMRRRSSASRHKS